MKNSFRITKYSNRDHSGNVISEPSDWTSFYDVGEKVTLDDYLKVEGWRLKVEGEYLDFIYNLCIFLDVHELLVDNLEINSDKCMFTDNNLVSNGDILLVAKSVLREEVWCKLISEKVEVHFGYDFYMYLICDMTLREINEKIKTSLIVEEFKSPYL